MTRDEPETLWSADDCAEYLRIGVRTFRAYVYRDQAPPPDRIYGGKRLWFPETIQQWDAQRPRQPRTRQP